MKSIALPSSPRYILALSHPQIHLSVKEVPRCEPSESSITRLSTSPWHISLAKRDPLSRHRQIPRPRTLFSRQSRLRCSGYLLLPSPNSFASADQKSVWMLYEMISCPSASRAREMKVDGWARSKDCNRINQQLRLNRADQVDATEEHHGRGVRRAEKSRRTTIYVGERC